MPGDPLTMNRVFRHTDENVNAGKMHRITAAITYYLVHPEEIDHRLDELDREWDIERALETNAACLASFGVLMSMRNRAWLVLPMAVLGFLLQHAIQGWCPPIEVLRRLGFRTREEILRERNALRALRGDYDTLAQIRKEPVDKQVSGILQTLAE